MIEVVILVLCTIIVTRALWPDIEYQERPKAWHLLAIFLVLNVVDYAGTVFVALPNGIHEGNNVVLFLGGPAGLGFAVLKLVIAPALLIAGTWATNRWGGDSAKRIARRALLLAATLFVFVTLYNSVPLLALLGGSLAGAPA